MIASEEESIRDIFPNEGRRVAEISKEN